MSIHLQPRNVPNDGYYSVSHPPLDQSPLTQNTQSDYLCSMDVSFCNRFGCLTALFNYLDQIANIFKHFISYFTGSSPQPVSESSLNSTISNTVSDTTDTAHSLPINSFTSMITHPLSNSSPSIVNTLTTPSISITSISPALPPLQMRINVAKTIIHAHLNDSENINRCLTNRIVPQTQWGVIVRLRYNGQEAMLIKNWSDADVRVSLENGIQDFLSSAANREQAQGDFQMQTILFQRTNSFMVNYYNPFSTVSFPNESFSIGYERGPCSFNDFNYLLRRFFRNQADINRVSQFIASIPY